MLFIRRIHTGKTIVNSQKKFGITVLGSGSKGNASVIHGPDGLVLLDAGFTAKELEKRLSVSGIAPQQICAIIITHEHSDHMKGCRVFSDKYGIKTYMTTLTCSGGLRANLLPERKTLFSTGCAFELCGMKIEAFTVPHDVDTVGFVFHVGELKLGVATDLGHLNLLARQKLRGCRILMLESNHDLEMLQNSARPIQLKRRIVGRHGHLSNTDALAALPELLDDRTRELILAHLSGECNNFELLNNLAQKTLANLQRTDILLEIARQEVPLATRGLL